MTSADLVPQDSPVRAEIQFFMDKTFQVSLAYVVALGAILALSNSATAGGFAQDARMTTLTLIACLLLLLNVVYLTLAIACLFAVLKRGLFALTHSPNVSATWHSWEVFVRKEEEWKITNWLPALAWNVDNYYAIPIVVLVVVMSGLGATVCFTSHAIIAVVAAIFLCSLHAIPLWMLWQLKNLNAYCRERMEQTLVAADDSGRPELASEG